MTRFGMQLAYRKVKEGKEELMVKIMVVSHHTLATSLIETLEMISGQSLNERFMFLNLEADTGMSVYKEQLTAFLQQNQDDLLVLCDLGYGSPISTLYVGLCETSINYKIISGVNLAMMLVAYTNQDKGLEELAELVIKEARASIDFCFQNKIFRNDDE